MGPSTPQSPCRAPFSQLYSAPQSEERGGPAGPGPGPGPGPGAVANGVEAKAGRFRPPTLAMRPGFGSLRELLSQCPRSSRPFCDWGECFDAFCFLLLFACFTGFYRLLLSRQDLHVARSEARAEAEESGGRRVRTSGLLCLAFGIRFLPGGGDPVEPK